MVKLAHVPTSVCLKARSQEARSNPEDSIGVMDRPRLVLLLTRDFGGKEGEVHRDGAMDFSFFSRAGFRQAVVAWVLK